MKVDLVRRIDSVSRSEMNVLLCAAVLRVIATILSEDIERSAQIVL